MRKGFFPINGDELSSGRSKTSGINIYLRNFVLLRENFPSFNSCRLTAAVRNVLCRLRTFIRFPRKRKYHARNAWHFRFCGYSSDRSRRLCVGRQHISSCRHAAACAAAADASFTRFSTRPLYLRRRYRNTTSFRPSFRAAPTLRSGSSDRPSYD